MRIQKNSNINFNAKFIGKVQVQKFNPQTKLYHPQEVSFVEIEPNNIEDVMALSDAASMWINEKFASNIAYCANLLYQKILPEEKYKIYAITTQRSNFENLYENKLLGMAEVENIAPNAIDLNYLQVNSNIIYSYDEQPYKNIGSKIVESLKKLYQTIELTSARGSVKEFYIKNGFKYKNKEKNQFVWQKEPV